MTGARNLALPSLLVLTLAACGGGGGSGGDNTIETPQTLEGSSADDTLQGGAGNDTLTGLAGNDLLYGKAGQDSLDGGPDDDTLYGEEGSDTYIFEAGHGNDTIEDSAGSTDTITLAEDTDATKVNLKLVENGEERNLTIETAATHSITIKNWHQSESKIEQLQINDRIYNLDSYSAETSLSELGLILNGTADDDYLAVPVDGKDELYGGEGNDNLISGADDDYLEGGAGNDNLSGGTGDDELLGGDGDDTYSFEEAGPGNDVIDDSAGNDTIWLALDTVASQVSLELVDNAGNKNLIIRTSDQDSITIQNWNQQDYPIEKIQIARTTYHLEDYSDQTRLNQLDSTTRGTDGDDTLSSGDGTDEIYGGEGKDTLNGSNGNDTLYGGGGDDTYIFGAGHGEDTISDTQGSDTIQLAEGTNPGEVSLDLENGELIIGNSNQGKITIRNWTLPDPKIWLIRIGATGPIYDLGAYSDQLFLNQLNASGGGEAATLQEGTDGDDTLTGDAVNNTLNGGKGHDTYIFQAGHGDDTIEDEAGDDLIQLAEDTDPTKVELKRANIQLIIRTSAEDSITIRNWTQSGYKIEKIRIGPVPVQGPEIRYRLDPYIDRIRLDQLGLEVVGTDGRDTLQGGDGADELNGRGGNDTLHGNAGDDTLYGNSGHDELYGDAGWDTLYGGDGQDDLYGGVGWDTLYGGEGNDTYIFEAGHGKDTINDTGGNFDRIQLAAGTNPSQVSLELVDDPFVDNRKNLIIRTSDQDSITIEDWKLFSGSQINRLRIGPQVQSPFIDIDYWLSDYTDQTRLDQLGLDISGTYDGDDTLQGSDNDDLLFGYDGDDTLYGYGGDDRLFGNDGKDTLYGGAGDDLLIGVDGNDTYIFETGHGNDTIDDEAGSDLIQLAAGTNPGQVSLKLENGDLLIGNSDQGNITIRNWTQSGYKIEKIRIGPTGQTYNLGAYNGQFNSLNQLTPID